MFLMATTTTTINNVFPQNDLMTKISITVVFGYVLCCLSVIADYCYKKEKLL